jgi:hypothetical protein
MIRHGREDRLSAWPVWCGSLFGLDDLLRFQPAFLGFGREDDFRVGANVPLECPSQF